MRPERNGLYRPTDKESFMNERQRDYFRKKLLGWREDILREAKETLAHLQDENQNHPDLADRASSETERSIELRARDRQRKLIAKIDAALQRIDEGTYGYCEETGEPISIKRLEARPIATLSVEAQERHERRERVARTTGRFARGVGARRQQRTPDQASMSGSGFYSGSAHLLRHPAIREKAPISVAERRWRTVLKRRA